ncbi:Protein abnormal spindle [Pseudolycoriella hygida]|uniref:Protein abnormal spindle n=1 Tax=Pseudolycoriella hygida TaxID=35572 RepID=A0A9Q0MUF2_9DIPT|nr:Protein abnormal spindle [Pseudolycoriella hygida]
MEIVWTPKVEVKTKDTITIIDDRYFKKDVAIVFKSIDSNCSNKVTKPAATKLKNVTGKLKIKSPSPPQALLRHTMMLNKQRQKSMGKETMGGKNIPPPLPAAEQMPLNELNIFNKQSRLHQNHGKENHSPSRSPLSATALFDDIQFTPVNLNKKKFGDLNKEDIDYMASLPTPVAKPPHNFTYALGNPSDTMEITSFEPNIASTIGKGAIQLESLKLSPESDPRRKLFDMTAASLCQENVTLPTATGQVLNVTHTIVPALLTNIKEECQEISDSEDPSARQSDQQGNDTLHKKFQSMQSLDDFSFEQKMQRHYLGSMPALTDSEAVQSIERNRYFAKSVESDLQTKENRVHLKETNALSSSLWSFAEGDFLAQSSRFNLNESHGIDVPLINVDRREFAVPQPVDSYRTKRPSDDDYGKRKSKWSPPKRTKLDCSSNSSISSIGKSSVRRNTSNWGGVKPKKFPYAIPKLNLTRYKEEERVVFFDPEHHFKTVINPDVFAATTTNDPFLCATMYLDDECIEKHEMNFKKWLNALVTIPWDVDSDKQQQIDFGKLFNDVRGKSLSMAETKEQVSSHYLTTHRMQSLRKTATALYMSENMTSMLQKLCVQIERGQLKIRDGVDLHLDIVLQRELLQLLLYFNPLWLRISLEVIYGEIINMSHNFDIMSLSSFIVNRLFKNKHLEQKYCKVFAQRSDQLKKFSLKKLFMLLVFLDNAKQQKIIKHNPCLFVKTSPYKETKEILCKFSSLILGNMGDIQRDLKRIGIVLSHKQTYIEEFDYAFRNLAVDLRDGIRLTKVMEIILLRDDMVNLLRVPAISRLQKVYNVDLALKALNEAGYVISGGIIAADIADGHREKTLSLLWQIIYKFRAPKFNEAAILIQSWWRRSWLKVIIKKRIRAKLEKARTLAAICIQASYRGHMSRKRTKLWHEKRTDAAIVLQSHIRRYLAQKAFRRQRMAARYIEQWYQRTCLYNRDRNLFLHKRNSVIIIQQWYRRIRFARKIEAVVPLIVSLRNEIALKNRYAVILQERYRAARLMRLERSKFVRLRSSAIVIQQRYRALLLMRKDRAEYLQIRETIISVQRRLRANIKSKEMRNNFQSKKRAALCIQKYFRAKLEARKVRTEFLAVKKATEIVQVRYRARLQMLKALREFQTIKLSAIAVQQRYRARVKMLEAMRSFHAVKHAASVLQVRYRAIVKMRQQREKYLRIKSAVQFVQLRWRATLMMRKHRDEYMRIRMAIVFVQRRVVANRQMLQQRTEYVKLKAATICIQSWYRGKLKMREERASYHQLRWACIFLQQKYRGNKIAQIELQTFLRLKNCAIRIQNRFRANQLTKSERKKYLNLRQAAVSMQQMFRGKLKMRKERQNYLNLVKAATFVQRKYRARRAMETELVNFKEMKWSATVIQERFRAQMRMRRERVAFVQLRSSTITIQRWIRSLKLARDNRQQYLSYRQKVVSVQRRYRAKLQMREDRSNYEMVRWAVLLVQRKFRAQRMMQLQRKQFERIRNAAIVIQRRFSANRLANKQMIEYQLIIESVKLIQTHFRSFKAMKEQRNRFVTLRTATVTIQKFFRSYQLTKTVRTDFVVLKESTIFLQRLYRANRAMRAQNAYYVQLRHAAIVLQTAYRANVLMKSQREIYQKKRNAALTIQKYYRAVQAMKVERRQYLTLRNAVLLCQRKFRANLLMLQQRCSFLIYRTKVTLIQRKFRATLDMRTQRTDFERLRKSAICVQRRFRANILAVSQRCSYLKLKWAAVFVQRKFRANKAMKIERDSYLQQRSSCIVLQKRFRAMVAGRNQRLEYLRIRSATLVIQNRFIAIKLMREQRTQFQRKRNAATVIQTRWRSFLAMKECRANYERLRTVVIKMQKQYRAKLLMRAERDEFLKCKRSAIVIQNWFRATLLMRNLSNQYKLIRCLVVCIQHRFRAKLAMKNERKMFLQIRSAAIVIQRRYRAHREMISERNAWIKTQSTVLGLQSRIRGCIAREEYRKKLTPEYVLLMRQSKCALKIQAFWRGWNLRRKRGPKALALKNIRSKIAHISKNVKQDDRISNIMTKYVAVLNNDRKGNRVDTLNVLIHITRISRMVPHLLINDSDFVVNFCYGVMSQAIRSELDKQIIEQCSYIILNLARYELTKAKVFRLKGLTTIAQMLLRWCDKDCQIFNTLCTLIYIFCQSEQLTKEIRTFMTSYDAELFTLHEIKRLVKRKENMRKNKIQHSSTPSRLDSRQRSQLPMLKPDFGMNSTEPYIFLCSIFAFDTILKKLNIRNI